MMMKNGLYFFWATLSLGVTSACGLKYTPPTTKSDLIVNRQTRVSNYIQESYKDSSITYQSISFAQPTVVKPYIYEQLDSLYEIKYANEQRGKYDKSLEEKISNQKIVIQSSNQKIKHVEHHVYAMQKPTISYIYFSDIYFDNNGKIVDYITTNNYEIPTVRLSLYKSFILGESLIQSGYQASEGERKIFNLLHDELDRSTEYQKSDYAIQLTNVLYIIKQTKAVDTKSILRNLAVVNLEDRLFNSSTDKLIRADGLYQGEDLIGYEVEVETANGRTTILYNTSFNLLD